MALPKAQNPLDWLTQVWNIALGEKVDPEKDAWLLGTIGDIGGIADRLVDQVAEEENLSVHRNLPSAGLIDGFQDFGPVDEKLNEKIKAFYINTLDYEFDVWTQWKPIFGSFGYVVRILFSQRIQQLNLPLDPLDTAAGIKSEIIHLLSDDGKCAYRVWFRRLKKNNEVVYSGIYSRCTIPSGEECIKIVFPLPQGNATVIMKPRVDANGNLVLESRGKRCGDPGFYFIVEDRKGILWKHYVPSFHERIFVYEDSDNTLRTDHSMSVWGWRAYDLHYKIKPIVKNSA